MKSMKKSISILLAVVMIFSMMSVAGFSVSAAETPMTMVVGDVNTSFSDMYDSYSKLAVISAKSSNTEVATITIDPKADKSVKIAALSVGQTTITVYANGAVYQTVKLTVTDKKPALSGRYVLVHNSGDIGYFNEGAQITFTTSKEDYVWVRNYDTGVQYCTDGWQGYVDEVTLVNEKSAKKFDKLYVPAGTSTFTLVDNGDDTFTLTREDSEPTTTGGEDPTPTGSVEGDFVLVCDQGDLGHFENGAITVTFAKDSYVWVRNYDTGVQYCTDGWQGFVEEVTLVNEKVAKKFDKMYVPAGEQTLTLVDNGNDTFTLSYGEPTPTSPTTPTQPIPTELPTTPTEPDTRDVYVALGDSIAAGYGLESTDDAYPSLIANEKDYQLNNLAVSGHTSQDLLALLNDEKVADTVAKADIITISIGANDFLKKVTELLPAIIILGPDCPQVKAVLAGLETNLSAIMAKIRKLNPDTSIVIQTVFNPIAIKPVYFEDTKGYIDVVFQKMNNVISKSAETQDNVYVSDVYTAFADDFAKNKNPDIIQDDGAHPSKLGHQIIFNTVLDTINKISPEEISYVIGDADGDGVVSVFDASTIQKAIIDSITLDELCTLAADADEDGEITINDATLVQKYLADLDIGSAKVGEKVIIK